MTIQAERDAVAEKHRKEIIEPAERLGIPWKMRANEDVLRDIAAAEAEPTINRITRDDVEMFRASTHDNDVLSTYQRIATKSAIYPGQGTPLGLNYCALKGAGEAGEFAEHVGKAMRDDGLIVVEPRGGFMAVHFTNLTPERRTALIKEIGDQLWYLAAKCNELGISLSEAATINLEKLCDRTERDALRGSGDER